MADAAPARREAAVRALCNWPDASVAPRLVELVQNAKDAADRRAAQQALARVAALPDKRSAAERLAMLKTAMTLATSVEERNYVLEACQGRSHGRDAALCRAFSRQARVCPGGLRRSGRAGPSSRVARREQGGIRQALDVVIRTSKDAEIVDRATRYKKGQTRLLRSPTGGK